MAIISEAVLSAGCRVPVRMCGFGYVAAGRRFGTECADRSLVANQGSGKLITSPPMTSPTLKSDRGLLECVLWQSMHTRVTARSA